MVPTSIFGPLENRGDLVALLGLADSVASGSAHTDRVQVGLNTTQVGCGCGWTVRDLEVNTVCLHTDRQYMQTLRDRKEYTWIICTHELAPHTYIIIHNRHNIFLWKRYSWLQLHIKQSVISVGISMHVNVCIWRFVCLFVYLEEARMGESIHGHHCLLSRLVVHLALEDSSCCDGGNAHTLGGMAQRNRAYWGCTGL